MHMQYKLIHKHMKLYYECSRRVWYGVYLAQRQLEEIEDQSYKSPTKLIRNLLTAFYKPTTLAESSCMDTRKYPPLNKDITRACFSK